MNATNRWLDAAKRNAGLSSDYQLAKALDISTQRLGNYRGDAARAMDDDLAVKVASLAKVPPILVLAEVAAQRSKNSQLRSVWLDVARNAGRAAVLIAAISAALVAVDHPALAGWNPHRSEVSAALPYPEAGGDVEYYVNRGAPSIHDHSAARSVPAVTVASWTILVCPFFALALFLRCFERGPITKREE